VNDVPTIANLAGDSLGYNEGDGAVVIEQGADAAVTDVDSSDFDTGASTVSFQAGEDNTEDVLAVRNQGTGFGQIGISGSNVTYEGTTIGTFTGGSGGVDLVITLNANADAIAVSALLNNVTYENTDIDNPTAGARTVRYVLTDGDGGTSANYDATVTVSGVNDVPTIANLGGDSLGYNEGDGAVVIEQGADAAVTDVDSSDLDTGTLTVSFQAGEDNTEDVLAVRNQGTGFGQIGVSGSNVTYEGTTIGTFTGGSGGVDLVITLNANADAIAVSALLNNVTYENTDIDNPTAGARTVRYVLTDGDGGTSANYDATVTVSGVNDVSTIANLAGDSLGYNEGDGAVVIEQGTNAAVTDVDSSDLDTGTLTVSFQAGSDNTEDVLAVRNQGTGFGQIGISGSNVTYEGTTIGTFTGGSGGVDLVITLNANADAVAVSALLNNVTYENTDIDNPTVGARTVRYVLTDGDGGTSADYDATVTVSGVNDLPTIANLAGDSLGYNEGDGAVVIEQGTDAAVTDVDSSDFDTGTLTVSFQAGEDNTEDVLAVRNQGTGLGQIGVSGSNVTYEGTTIGTFTGGSGGVDLVITLNTNADAVAVSALLNNVTYENTDIDNPTAGAHIVRYVLTDGDGGTSANYDATVTVNKLNDAPIVTNLAGDTLNYTEGDGVVVIEQGTNATVTDVDSLDFDTGALTVSFSAGSDPAEDVLAIRNQGNGVGQIGVAGSFISYEGTTFATYSGGSGGVALAITFDPNASPTAVSALIRNITFENTNIANPTVGARIVQFVVDDGDGAASIAYATTVNVFGSNDVPTVSGLNGDGFTYSEGDGAVVVDQGGDAVVSDVDSLDFDGGNLTATSATTGDLTEDDLSIRDEGTGAGQIGFDGLNVTYGGVPIGTSSGGSAGTPLVISLNANADAAAVSALTRNITYENTDIDNPTTDGRTISLTINDGDGGTSLSQDVAIAISRLNDDPFDSGSMPTDVSVAEDVSSNIDLSGMNVTDVDAGGGTLTMTLTTWTGGILSAIDSGGVNVGGSGTGTLVLSGIQANLNSFLDTPANIQYQHSISGTNGDNADTIQVDITDSGNTGSGGGGTVTLGIVNVDIASSNDPPALTSLAGDSLNYAEGSGALVIDQGTAANIVDIDSSDFDSGTVTVSFVAGSDSGEDVLAVRNQGTGVGQIGVSGANITYNSGSGATSIGTFSGGSGGVDLVINLTSAQADPTAVAALVQNITYENTDLVAATTGTRIVRFVVNDGDGGTSGNYEATVAVGSPTALVTFQQGVNGYVGNEDTYVYDVSPNTSFGNDSRINVDYDPDPGDDTAHGLIRFENIFGAGAGQIAYGSTIVSASLTVEVFNNSGNSETVSLNRMLNGWTESSTWNSMVGGIQLDDVEAVNVADGTVPDPNSQGSQTITGLDTTLQLWSDGTANNGWVFSSDGTNGWDFYSSEYGTVSLRPYLTVEYVSNNAPAIVSLGGDTLNYSENDGSVVIDQPTAAAIVDDSPNFGSGALTVDLTAGGTVNDRLAIRNQGTAVGQIGISGSNVTYNFGSGAVAIGTFSGGTDGGTPLVVSLNTMATPTAAQSLLQNITYENVSENPNENPRNVRFTLTDGGGTSNLADISINVSAVNDDPLNTVPGTQAVNEETLTAIGGVSISDVDASGGSVTTQLQVASGILDVTLSGGATISAGGSGTRDLTILGTVADVNATLASLQYTGDLDVTGIAADTLTVTTNDLGNTGSGGARQDIDNIQIDINPLNDDPTNNGSLPTDIAVTEDVSSNLDLSAIDLADVDTGGGSLTVTLTTSTGGDLNATTGGGVTVAGSGTGVLTLSGTLTDLNTFMDTASSINYLHGTAHYNGDNVDTIQVDINDNGNTGAGGGGTITLGTVNVDITAVNDAPINTVPGTQAVNEETLTAIGGISILDVDASGGSVTTQLQVANGILDVTLSGGATISAGGNGTSDLTILGTVADVNATLASLQYTGDLDVTGIAADTLTVTTNDLGNTGSGGARQDIDNIQIDINPLNDDPTNNGSLTTDIAVTEDVSSNLDLSAIDLADVDAGGGSLTVTLTTSTGGDLTATTGGGVTVAGSGTGVLTLSGTLTDLNTFMDTASSINYLHGTAHYNGDNVDTIQVDVNDNGNTGAGGGGTITLGTVNVDINAVNDAPVNSLPGGLSTNEDTPLTISIANGNAVQISDVDAGLAPVRVQLTLSTGGSLSLAQTTGLTFLTGDGTNDPAMDFAGTMTDINAALDGMVFTPTGDFNGIVNLTVSTDDQGNSGFGGPMSDVDLVPITVNAVNDDPLNAGSLVATITVTEDIASPVDLSLVDLADVDAAAGSLTLTLSTSAGGNLPRAESRSLAAGARPWHLTET